MSLFPLRHIRYPYDKERERDRERQKKEEKRGIEERG